jgi:hypothetical protein
MHIRIVKSGPGCVYAPGSILQVSDKKALYLIGEGFAEGIDAPLTLTMKPRTIREKAGAVRKPRSRPPLSPHMLPPRHICGCGLVFPDRGSLDKHRKECT